MKYSIYEYVIFHSVQGPGFSQPVTEMSTRKKKVMFLQASMACYWDSYCIFEALCQWFQPGVRVPPGVLQGVVEGM
jgi:hypothetical protein